MNRLTSNTTVMFRYGLYNDDERNLEGLPTSQEIYDKLKEYEDAEEQGRLIKPLCKIGDKVYMIINHEIFEEKLVKTSLWYETEYYGFDESLVGLDLFFDRKQAEVALKKTKG